MGRFEVWSAATLLAASLAGCGQTLDVGDDAPAPPVEEEEEGAHDAACEPTELGTWPGSACTADAASELVGVWDGYLETAAEGHDFSRFVVRILAASESEICGSVTFSDGPPPPAIGDGRAAYAPEIDGETFFGRPWPGFEYRITRGSFVDGRLRLSLSFAELWAEWCEKQTPIGSCKGAYQCSPPKLSTPLEHERGACFVQRGTSGELVEYDCIRLLLCDAERVCACDDAACAGNPETWTLAIDVRIEESEGSGSLSQYGPSDAMPARIALRP